MAFLFFSAAVVAAIAAAINAVVAVWSNDAETTSRHFNMAWIVAVVAGVAFLLGLFFLPK